MPLLKPTRRQIISAAVDEVRNRLRRKASVLMAQITDTRNEIDSIRSKKRDAAIKAQAAKLQPVADQLNDVASYHGYGRPFDVHADYGVVKPGDKITLRINHTPITLHTRAKYPKDPAKIAELQEQLKTLQQQYQRVCQQVDRVDDRSVTTGAIGESLNGECQQALDFLVKNIEEVALGSVGEETLAEYLSSP